ncbi:staphylopine uptake ABC transporter ATP-binding protein CntD [Paenibacillus thailandensis]|uniref:Staphylopine uptake ABC transporter ATP-binding protein CntD n=1 Tax=Paenibacillus thailandensis TaxID=393250 RepID=A0ABW5QUA0_9BACL
MNLLEVSNLRIWDSRSGNVIVPGSSFQVKEGSCLAIVGESGSGKSVTCRALMRLNKANIRHSGDIVWSGVNLAKLSDKEMRKIRGKHLCMIMQNGMRAFDPSCKIGVHLRETLVQHFGWNRGEIEAVMRRAMESVMLKDPIAIMNQYPHQLSGGMLQRIMIALAIALEPDIIIADEPTTALDTISQFEVMEQFMKLSTERGCTMIFVSHDLGVVRKIAGEVLVMKNGEIVERGPVQTIFAEARHEYTRYLTSSKLTLHRHFERIMGGVGVVKRSSGGEIV